jgi:hypothetical protein
MSMSMHVHAYTFLASSEANGRSHALGRGHASRRAEPRATRGLGNQHSPPRLERELNPELVFVERDEADTLERIRDTPSEFR